MISRDQALARVRHLPQESAVSGELFGAGIPSAVTLSVVAALGVAYGAFMPKPKRVANLDGCLITGGGLLLAVLAPAGAARDLGVAASSFGVATILTAGLGRGGLVFNQAPAWK